jgi:putative sterol carrier protein
LFYPKKGEEKFMGLKFGQEEWVQAYIEKLNANEAYAEAAATWEGDFLFVVLPDGGLEEEIRFYVDLYHGKARSGRQVLPDEEVDAAYVFTGKWGMYSLLIDGKLDPLKGLVQGKFKLKGNMGMVMRAVKAAKQLVETIKMVDTEKY